MLDPLMLSALEDERARNGRKATRSPPKDTERANSSFKDYPDYAKLNEGKHSNLRMDTFNTPPHLDKKQDTPTKLDKRWGLGDTRDLMQICELGFAKSMRIVGKEILKEVHEEIHDSISALRKEMSGTIDNLTHVQQTTVTTMLQELLSKVNHLKEDVEKPADLSHIDFGPVYAEIQSSQKLRSDEQHEAIVKLEKKLLKRVTDLTEEVRANQKRHEEKFLGGLLPQIQTELQKVQLLSELGHEKSSQQISEILAMQERLQTQHDAAAKELTHLKALGDHQASSLQPMIAAQLKKHTQEDCVKVDFEEVLSTFRDSHQSVMVEYIHIRSEIARIQQALNVDFAQVLEGIGDITGTKGRTDGDKHGLLLDKPDDCMKKKRFREYWTQTAGSTKVECAVQTHSTYNQHEEARHKPKKKPKPPVLAKRASQAVFQDAEAQKRKVREAMIKPPYNVADFYYESGVMRNIATSSYFENTVFCVILFNSVWIAVDTDHNNAAILLDAHPIFQIAENCFCLFFSGELLIRFGAFKNKRNCFRDTWFVFDFVLVLMMVVETWLITGVMLAAGIRDGATLREASILRLFRMVKLLRLSRMARLLRSIPELVVLIKGIGAASRTVVVFIFLWTVIVYIFAVFLRQTTGESVLGDTLFQSVPHAMNTLLLDGILPDSANFVNSVVDEMPVLFPFMMFFIMLAAVMLMYMLIGVLVEVVASIAGTEKEGLTTSAVASGMRDAFSQLGLDPEAPMTKHQFVELLYEPLVVDRLQDVGTDPVILLDMADVIFDNIDKDGQGMRFEKFIDTVLSMRGHNPATVKDTTSQLLVIKQFVKESQEAILVKMAEEVAALSTSIKDIKDRDGHDDYDDDDGEEVNLGYAATMAA
eukprot:TRINITY_DN33728_c0_g1_i1.p1 TRINITY_DN33728_c0_g1~~TRINITY_DN33728_c0_g1_i1.p1  ORF type:complete len:874 (-),score=279.97 TRINITY_DN33728_c0_g1_i1:371-2992(-)